MHGRETWKEHLMSAFWKTEKETILTTNEDGQQQWHLGVTFLHSFCMFAFIKKEKKKKLKKYMGRIYYSPWNESFFLCEAVASVTTGRAIFAGHRSFRAPCPPDRRELWRF